MCLDQYRKEGRYLSASNAVICITQFSVVFHFLLKTAVDERRMVSSDDPWMILCFLLSAKKPPSHVIQFIESESHRIIRGGKNHPVQLSSYHQ